MLLLETIFAIVILIVSLSVIIESLVSGYRATVINADYSKALILADNLMAELMHQRFIDPAFSKEENFPQPDERFRYRLKTASNDGDLSEVQLTVSWKSGSKENGVALTTWLTLNKAKDEKSN